MASTDSYYYLVSSLPMLRLGEPVALGTAAFLATCESLLAEADFARLARLRLVPGDAPSCQAERRWQEFEIYLRNLLVRKRAAEAGIQPDRWLRDEPDVFPGSQRQIEDALKSPNPLLREKALDELRWHHLEDCSVGHEFDFDALAIYHLKLQLAVRWAALDADAGTEILQELVSGSVEMAREKREIHEE